MKLNGSWGSKFGDPMFEFEVFRKQTYCIEKSCCDIVGIFRRLPQSFAAPRSHSAPPAVIWCPHSELAPVELCPLATPSYAPASDIRYFRTKLFLTSRRPLLITLTTKFCLRSERYIAYKFHTLRPQKWDF